MSSTARGGQRSEADYYATPSWCARRLLEKIDLPGGLWADPAAGEGAIVKEVNASRKDVTWVMTEIREECREKLLPLARGNDSVIIADFLSETHRSNVTWAMMEIREECRGKLLPLTRTNDAEYSVSITNPPFNLAMPFIRACLPISHHAIFLLRLNFLGSQERSDFIRETKPDLYILPNRPSFTTFTEHKRGKMATDSIEYAWFHFHEGSAGRYVMLDSSSKEERKKG